MRQYLFRLLRHLLVGLCAVVAAAALTGQPTSTAFAQAGTIEPTTQGLFDAIHANDFAAAQASVEAGAKVDVPGRWGMTAIELAIDKGYFKIAHYLVAVRNFQGQENDSKSKRLATRSAPEPGIQGGPLSAQSEEGQTVVPPPSAVTTAPAVPRRGSVATLPFTVPTQPAGNVTDQPFYAPLADLETTAGREEDSDSPAWPVGKPNPFDPGMPAVGSNLQIIGEIGSADPGIAFRPAGDFSRPTLETQTLPVPGTSSPPSTAEAAGTSPAVPDKAKKGSGFGSGVIGATKNFQ